jgi:hypothetical protein
MYNITSDSAEIRWTAPENTGGSPLTGYIVEIRESTRAVWRRVATVSGISTSLQLRDLTPGAEYVVRIIAKNQEGESSPLTSDFINVPRAKGTVTTIVAKCAMLPGDWKLARLTSSDEDDDDVRHNLLKIGYSLN